MTVRWEEMSIRETQAANLETLKAFDGICRRIGVSYWVIYGTLIGALRHRGFIPWDDDLDVGVLRADLERFLGWFAEHASEYPDFEIHNKYTQKGYPYNLTRFCNRNYRIVYDRYTEYKGSGAFLDVYAFDGMGKKEDAAYWQKTDGRRGFCGKMASLAAGRNLFMGKNLLTKTANFPLALLAKSRGTRYYLDGIDAIAQKFSVEESDYVNNTAWNGWRRLPQLRKEIFTNLAMAPFEDIEVPIPADYESFFRVYALQYGDYRKLPPESERHPTHGYKAYRPVK